MHFKTCVLYNQCWHCNLLGIEYHRNKTNLSVSCVSQPKHVKWFSHQNFSSALTATNKIYDITIHALRTNKEYVANSSPLRPCYKTFKRCSNVSGQAKSFFAKRPLKWYFRNIIYCNWRVKSQWGILGKVFNKAETIMCNHECIVRLCIRLKNKDFHYKSWSYVGERNWCFIT
jgi:hypothetical protein